jgi:hypothetical protein
MLSTAIIIRQSKRILDKSDDESNWWYFNSRLASTALNIPYFSLGTAHRNASNDY